MATRFIHQAASVADEATGSHAGIGVEASTGNLQFNADGTTKQTVMTTVARREVVTATNAIAASESGTTFYLSALAGFVSTLPPAAAGLWFEFVVATAPTSNGYTITADPADSIYGTVAANGAEDTVNGVTASAADNVILVHNVALKGDRVRFDSDGTSWYVSGMVNTFAAITANG